MRHSILVLALVGCANPTNEPQYVSCAPMGPAAMDLCHLEGGVDDGTGMGTLSVAKGSLHVPIKPESMWKAQDRDERMQLQATVDPAVEVPLIRLEHYDLSVEWTVTNLDDAPAQFKLDLNGANETFTYDPDLIVLNPGDNEAPPTPPLAGDIPIDVAAKGTYSGTFREDQLMEAAIDLDQISRGRVNPFAATLTVSKNADNFQPLTPAVYDPVTQMVTPGTPTGPAVPRLAFRQLVRVDLVFKPDHHMTLDYTLRLREHVDIIHDMGLNAPAGQIEIMDPAPYVP